jgi:multidrug efflux pump subunit AcrB
LVRVEEIVFGPPAGADVAVRFSGPDPVILRQLADDATRIFEKAGTITNPRTDWRQREILVEPIVDESRMRIAGATRSAIADTIRYGTSGLRVGELREDDTVIPIHLRLPESDRDGVDRLLDLSVWSDGGGSYVPMANLAERFEPRLVEALIHRRNRERTITALGGARGDLTEAAAGLFAALHRLDALEVRGIAVMPIPEEGPQGGLGAAINDRLRRAAAPRG